MKKTAQHIYFSNRSVSGFLFSGPLLVLVLLVFMAQGSPVCAQESREGQESQETSDSTGAVAEGAGVLRLGLEECVEMGLEAGERLQIARLRSLELENRRTLAKRSRLPSAELKGGYTRLSEVEGREIELPTPPGGSLSFAPGDTDAVSVTLELNQPIFTGFKIENGITQSGLALSSSHFAYEKAVQETRYRVEQAFWDLVEATETVSVTGKGVERAETLLAEVENMSDQGMTTREEVLQVDMSLEQARLKRMEAEHGRQMAALQLSLLLNLPEDTVIEAEYDFSGDGNPGRDGNTTGGTSGKNYDELLEKALEKRPDRQILLLQQEMKTAELRSVQSGWWPDLALSASLQYANPNSRQFPPADEFIFSWQVGIYGSIDIGGYKEIGPSAEALRLSRNMLMKQDEELIRNLSLQLKKDMLELELAGRRLQAAGTILEQARENYRIIYDRHRSGLAVNSDVTSAREKLMEAQLVMSRAYISLHRVESVIRFHSADGGEE